ncbi:MAG: 4Fe-4S binding protein [Candidatus Omnitrophica bacterium]|nr:4Fe-4S binding protein [Candidatus Omnitrophota bacterium]
MVVDTQGQQVIFTNEAQCRDCYRCVRVCPVKAIKVEGNQARVDADRCIVCGTCVRECPQGAKTYRKDIDLAESIIEKGGMLAASIAPAFAGVFEEWEYLRLTSALRRLGFKYVAETAIGAYMVARETAGVVRSNTGSHICTACPALVNFVEKYDPKRIPLMVPVVSPMIAHAKHIKNQFGTETKVVFIGPCVAKKFEAQRQELKGIVDCVLTFEELEILLSRRGIDLRNCEESAFDELPCGRSRIFPVEGGSLATAEMDTNVIDERIIFVSGFDEIKTCMAANTNKGMGQVIEPLLCSKGCVNGPGIKRPGNPFERRAKIIRYAKQFMSAAGKEPAKIDLKTNYCSIPVIAQGEVIEANVRAVLEKTGKARIEQQLNCGACGYSSCRDQAVAVVQGMAETSMCIPYMRRLAEQRSDRIMQTSPNGIVVLDQDFKIVDLNAAFGTMFKTGPSALGRHISQFVDPDPFEKVACRQVEIHDDQREYPQYNLVVREVVYALRSEAQYVGMFINITSTAYNAQQLQQVKDETVQQAQELYAHQIEMAKNLANFLGQYTAKGEQIVHKLLDAVNDKDSFRNKKI